MPSRGLAVIILSNFFHTPIDEILPEIMTTLLEGDVNQQPVEEPATYVGRYQAPDFDRIGREILVVLEADGLCLSIVESSGDVFKVTLHPWVKERFFTKRDGRFAGLMVVFDRDAADRVAGVTLDAYGWRVYAERHED